MRDCQMGVSPGNYPDPDSTVLGFFFLDFKTAKLLLMLHEKCIWLANAANSNPQPIVIRQRKAFQFCLFISQS